MFPVIEDFQRVFDNSSMDKIDINVDKLLSSFLQTKIQSFLRLTRFQYESSILYYRN